MPTVAHTTINIGAGGLVLGSASEFQTITSGAGNGRTFNRSVGQYVFIENTTGSAINATLKALQPGDVVAAGTTVADKVFSVPANDTILIETIKYLADSSGVVTVEAASTGLQLLAFYPNS